MTFDLTTLVTVLLELVLGGFIGLAGRALLHFTQLMDLNKDSEIRGYLQDAIERSIDYAVEVTRMREEDFSDPHVRETINSRAVEYLLNRVPDALNHFGIKNPDDARAMVQARVSRSLFH